MISEIIRACTTELYFLTYILYPLNSFHNTLSGTDKKPGRLTWKYPNDLGITVGQLEPKGSSFFPHKCRLPVYSTWTAMAAFSLEVIQTKVDRIYINICQHKSYFSAQWAFCQIHNIAGCACTGNAGNVFPAIAGSLTHGSRETFPAVQWCRHMPRIIYKTKPTKPWNLKPGGTTERWWSIWHLILVMRLL